jgi:hypothetical protein
MASHDGPGFPSDAQGHRRCDKCVAGNGAELQLGWKQVADRTSQLAGG